MPNHDQAKGVGKQIKGGFKEAAGKLTGDRETEAQGKADKAEGKIQKGYGDAKEKVKGAIDRA
ncbi:MAG: CsbD family protein [Pseudaminobacter sp.]|nr:CsbD family protein [Pseudaminobacter sp.]